MEYYYNNPEENANYSVLTGCTVPIILFTFWFLGNLFYTTIYQNRLITALRVFFNMIGGYTRYYATSAYNIFGYLAAFFKAIPVSLIEMDSQIKLILIPWFLINLLLSLLLFVSVIKAFVRARLKGWAVIIPIYNLYCFFLLTGRSCLFLAITYIISAIAGMFLPNLLPIFSIIVVIEWIVIISSILERYDLEKEAMAVVITTILLCIAFFVAIYKLRYTFAAFTRLWTSAVYFLYTFLHASICLGQISMGFGKAPILKVPAPHEDSSLRARNTVATILLVLTPFLFIIL